MMKWLKNKIEVFIYLLGLSLIIGGVLLAIYVNVFAGIALAIFGSVINVWQFWHMLFYYGSIYYDRTYEQEDRKEVDQCEE